MGTLWGAGARARVPNLATVLLAEDDFLFRMEFANVLRCAGWEVIEVATADAALDILRMPIRIDLVITDIRMPGRADGLDVARVAAIIRPSAAIALMSDQDELKGGERRWHILLPKPFSVDSSVQLFAPLLPTCSGEEREASLAEQGKTLPLTHSAI